MRRVIVSVAVVLVVSSTGCVLMNKFVTERCQRVTHMRFRRQMHRNVAEVEREDSRDEQTTPPACLGRRRA